MLGTVGPKSREPGSFGSVAGEVCHHGSEFEAHTSAITARSVVSGPELVCGRPDTGVGDPSSRPPSPKLEPQAPKFVKARAPRPHLSLAKIPNGVGRQKGRQERRRQDRPLLTSPLNNYSLAALLTTPSS